MKAEIRSFWDCARRRPNVYIALKPENDVEKACVLALYSVRGKVILQTGGEILIDFYPEGEKRG